MWIILLAAPLAVADDPFRDQVCPDTESCVGPGMCTEWGCVPRSCQPLVYCRSVLTSTQECEVNLTIDGETCQLVAGLGARSNDHRNEFWVAASLTNGNVDAFNLPNTWITPAIEASASVAGVETGDVSVGVYRSDILTEGPRGGVLGAVSPSPEHQWTHLAFEIHQGDGATAGNDIVVGIYFLDSAPDGCYARSSASTVPLFECPPPREIL